MKAHVGGGSLFLAVRTALVLTAGLQAPMAPAQQPDASAFETASATYEFSIPEQPLSQALLRFSELTGVQLFFDAPLTRNLKSGKLAGRRSANEALAILLEGTGLVHRFLKPNVFTLEKATANSNTRVLGPVRVEGVNASAVAGINGSTDATATEGTNSYTSSALSIASKSPQSIKDTPQSVSVITQQRMQEQNLTDLTSVMNQGTGITLVAGSSNLDTTFYSRGFALDRIQIDGGAPLATTAGNGDGAGVWGFLPLIDLAMYDHVEILRGADGLFNGYGTPGGTVNLTRKRPLDHRQVIIEGQAGSWNNHRTVVDASGPLGFDGKFRGRAVLSYQDQDYFYTTASNDKTVTYGVLEADLTSSTIARAGFSLTQQDSVLWLEGLPRYESGDDLELPRSTCLCFDWNRAAFETQEVFAQLDQQLREDWSLRLNVTRSGQEQHRKYGAIVVAVNPITGRGPILLGNTFHAESLQTLADFTVNGEFELFGQRQQLALGANYQDVDGGGYKGYPGLIDYPFPAVDVLNFHADDPAYVEPASRPPESYYPIYGQKQWGAYATLRLTLLAPLHFTTGLRYSHYEWISVREVIDSQTGASRRLPASTYSDHDLSWPPAYSLSYDIGERWSAYASYADIYESQATRVDHAGNPIDPITGSNVEAGIKLEAAGGKLNAALAAYRIEKKNFSRFIDYGAYADTFGLLPDGQHTCCHSNDSNQVHLSRGVDLEVTGELLPGWQLYTGYTFNINEFRGSEYGSQEGVPLVSRSPKHLFKLWTGYRFQDGGWLRNLDVGGGLNAQTDSYNAGDACVEYGPTTDANGNPTTTCLKSLPYEYTQGAYAIFSARVGYRFDSNWSAALNINNLTDRTYYQTMGDSGGGNWYGEPRNFMLTLRGSFN